MWLMKNISVCLIIIVVSVLAADSVQATDVIEGWVGRYSGNGTGNDVAYSLAVDSSDNIYVTGSSYNSVTNYDYVTVKYDSVGNQLWVRSYNWPGNVADYPCKLVLDGLGNVCITGKSGDDYATIKYDSNGNLLWANTYKGPGNSYDYAYAIAADSTGNVYVTGGSVGSGTGADYATIKYDANGAQKWVARYNGPGSGGDIARAMAVDSSGNVYVTGSSVGSGTGADYTTIKYDPNGTEVWVSRYSRSSSGDYAYAITLDSSDNVYVTGESYSSSTGYDYATVKYDKDGNQKWAKTYIGTGSGDDCAYAIALDSTGNVYVTGSSTGSGTYTDYATIKYDPTLNQK